MAYSDGRQRSICMMQLCRTYFHSPSRGACNDRAQWTWLFLSEMASNGPYCCGRIHTLDFLSEVKVAM